MPLTLGVRFDAGATTPRRAILAKVDAKRAIYARFNGELPTTNFLRDQHPNTVPLRCNGWPHVAMRGLGNKHDLELKLGISWLRPLKAFAIGFVVTQHEIGYAI